MAKLKDLAGLAALGMLGYKMSQGNKSTTDTGDETSRLAARKPAPVTDTGDETSRLANRFPAPNYSNEGRSAAPVSTPKSEAATKPVATKSASTVSSSEEGMKNYKPRRTPVASTVSSSEEGMKNYKPRRTPAAPPVTKSETPAPPKPTTKSKNILEEAKEEARRRAAASQATPTSSSTSPTTRTPFPGSSALNKKHGGAVKMASGGMAASRRADGIAQRGKTRGKMC